MDDVERLMGDVERLAREIAADYSNSKCDWDRLPVDDRKAFRGIAAIVLRWGRKPKPEQPARRTVKVRVAVAVDGAGDWAAWGRVATDDALAESNVYDPGDALYWLTADLPIPEDVTVQATVEGGE